MLRKLTKVINKWLKSDILVRKGYLKRPGKETGVLLEPSARKGAWSELLVATSLVRHKPSRLGDCNFFHRSLLGLQEPNERVWRIMMDKKQSKLSISKKLPMLNLNAAGIDIGSENHFIAVPEGRDIENVREFTSFTCDLKNISTWLKKCEIETVAMESTGVYWIPLYDYLEKEGFEVLLVDARHVKNVSGRKSDVLDCQWLQQLHTYGLLSGAFRPPEHICALRSLLRHRDKYIKYAASHTLHMQKALSLMNLRLHNVIADITGSTGMKIIRSIIGGETTPSILAQHRHGRCRSSIEEIEKSLEGSYRSELVFALKQSVETYDFYRKQVELCDLEIEKTIRGFEDKDFQTVEIQGKSPKGKNEPSFDVAKLLVQKSGVDLTKIPGISATTALTILSEIGFSVDAWNTEKHFSSWLGVCPGTKISGGKALTTKTKVCANKVAAALRLAATNLWRSQTSMGAFYRRMCTRLGKPGAVTATAHKLARLVYAMLKNGTDYVEQGVQAYEKAYQSRVIKTLEKRARSLGFELIEKTDSGVCKSPELSLT